MSEKEYFYGWYGSILICTILFNREERGVPDFLYEGAGCSGKGKMYEPAS